MEKDIENLIEELTKVRPEMLNEEALKLFNTIMVVLDERDKLKDDNRNYVIGFEDSFGYADESKVILEIEEVKSND